MRNFFSRWMMSVAVTCAFVACGQDVLVCRYCETDSTTEVGVDTDRPAPVDAGANAAEPPDDTSEEKTVVLYRDFTGQETGEPNLIMLSESGEVRQSVYEDHNTVTIAGGAECLKIHAQTADDLYEMGRGVQLELPLDQQADMRNEDFTVSFDIYLPEAYLAVVPQPVFGLYRTVRSAGIYSKWYSLPNEAGWHHIEGDVRVTGGDIVYSGLEQDPDDWIFDHFAIYVFVQNPDENVEIEFCLDNIQVYRP